MTVTQLAYIGIGVKDTDAWEDFGSNFLGLDVSTRLDDGTLYLRQDEYHHRFIVEPTGEDDIKYAGWLVPTMDAFRDVEERLRAAGVEFEEGSPEECSYRKVVRFITFKDPNGFRAEICYGLHVLADAPFHSPRPVTGFNAGKLGLGHIFLSVKDVDETERFYRDLLGFRISDYIIRRDAQGALSKAAFFHVNGRHHSMAISGSATPRRLGHFMIEAKTMDDVGITYDLAKKKNVPIRSDIGVHSNDRMFSFYVESPSGFGVEFGCDGIYVDDSQWVVQRLHTGNIWGHQRLPRPEATAAR